MNETPANPRHVIALYRAWRVGDGSRDPMEHAPDLHVEARVATFHVEPQHVLRISASMARKEAFPFDGFALEELALHVVDDAVIADMEATSGWFELPASGDLSLVRRTSNRFETLGRTRFVTGPADLAATLKRHGLPEAWVSDHSSAAWAPRPYYGPSFEEFAERLRDFARDADETGRHRRKVAAPRSRDGIGL